MAMTSGIMWYGKQIHPPTWDGEELSVEQLFTKLHEMGLETVDIFGRSFEAYDQDTIAAALDASGLRCACYYIGADLVADEPEKVQAADEAFTVGIERAQALGAPICFSCGSQHSHRGEEDFQRYLDRLGEKLQLFKEIEQTLVIENAGHLLHTGDHMVRAAEALGDEGLRLCPDTGNFTLWGVDEIDAVTRCLPWTAHMHIKDYAERWEEDGNPRGREAILGQGITPVAEIFEILHGEQWDGVVAWEPGPQDEQGVTDSVAQLMSLIG
ncbi:MAG: sugar phosphate isomerase/epimerase family protein [Armatimonadota bacterium]|jgi:sugar phosphate isomerase/epimerase